MPSPQRIEEEREKFKIDLIKRLGVSAELRFSMDDNGFFADPFIEARFEGWLACAESHEQELAALKREIDWKNEAKRAFWHGLEIGAVFGSVSIEPRWNEYIEKRLSELAMADEYLKSGEQK